VSRSFTIRDRHGRTWGSFGVMSEKYGKIFGYLEPTEQFAEVKAVFVQHARSVAQRSRDAADRSIDQIAELGAYVVDNETGEAFDLRGEIFVDEKLLVACATYPRNSS
jgi:hypothetical protein